MLASLQSHVCLLSSTSHLLQRNENIYNSKAVTIKGPFSLFSCSMSPYVTVGSWGERHCHSFALGYNTTTSRSSREKKAFWTRVSLKWERERKALWTSLPQPRNCHFQPLENPALQGARSKLLFLSSRSFFNTYNQPWRSTEL